MKTFRIKWENTELTSIVEAETADEAYGMSGEFYFEQGSSGSMPCPISVGIVEETYKEMIIAEDSCNGEEEAFKDWMEANYPEIITTIENTLHGGYFENGELKESKFWDDFCIA